MTFAVYFYTLIITQKILLCQHIFFLPADLSNDNPPWGWSYIPSARARALMCTMHREEPELVRKSILENHHTSAASSFVADFPIPLPFCGAAVHDPPFCGAAVHDPSFCGAAVHDPSFCGAAVHDPSFWLHSFTVWLIAKNNSGFFRACNFFLEPEPWKLKQQ